MFIMKNEYRSGTTKKFTLFWSDLGRKQMAHSVDFFNEMEFNKVTIYRSVGRKR